MGLGWQERTGKAQWQTGDVQVLDPVSPSWITIIDLESCFSFFQSETNQDTNKRTGQGAHIRGKDKSSNLQIVREKTEKVHPSSVWSIVKFKVVGFQNPVYISQDWTVPRKGFNLINRTLAHITTFSFCVSDISPKSFTIWGDVNRYHGLRVWLSLEWERFLFFTLKNTTPHCRNRAK